MIIVLTNRMLANMEQSKTSDINVVDMGVVLADLNGDENRVNSGLLLDGDKKIRFYPKGNEGDLFSGIPDEELNRPWVFFVHGFHQDPDENIAKARALHDNHNVNVINFSWPSKPLDKRYKFSEDKKSLLLSVIKGMSLSSISTMTGYKLVKGYLNDVWLNYEPALENAENSDKDLLAAISLVKDNMSLTKPPVLLVHSMGNYLLEKVIVEHGSLNSKFSNIILHQADVDCPGYDWVLKLKENLTVNNDERVQNSRLYITTNTPDFVLAASCARRKILNKDPTERLGQTQKHYLKENIHYIDFTDAPGIDTEHEIFKRKRANDFSDIGWGEFIDGNIFDLLSRILHSKHDELPLVPSEASSGMIRMPTEIYLYRAEEIIDPHEWFDPTDADLISSADGFSDPLHEEDASEEDV